MQIILCYIGKTKHNYLKEGISLYTKRLQHYCNFSVRCIKDIGRISKKKVLIKKEFESFAQFLKNDDFVVLLDEKGKQYSSMQFSTILEKWQINATKRLIFVIGGSFGVHDNLKNRANVCLSLSAMTFSHQMIRLFILEQIYRAFTIMKNEKYHNQ